MSSNEEKTEWTEKDYEEYKENADRSRIDPSKSPSSMICERIEFEAIRKDKSNVVASDYSTASHEQTSLNRESTSKRAEGMIEASKISEVDSLLKRVSEKWDENERTERKNSPSKVSGVDISLKCVSENNDKNKRSTKRKDEASKYSEVDIFRHISDKRDKNDKSAERVVSQKDAPEYPSSRPVRDTDAKQRKSTDISSSSRKLSDTRRRDDSPQEWARSRVDYNRSDSMERRRRSRSPLESRRKEYTEFENKERLSEHYLGRSSSFNRELRCRSRSRRSHSRSDLQRWPRLRSLTPDKRRYMSPNRSYRSPLRSYRSPIRSYGSPSRSSAVFYHSRTPSVERHQFDIFDRHGKRRDRSVTPLISLDPRMRSLSKEPLKRVPLSREEFDLLQKQLRGDLLACPPNDSRSSLLVSGAVPNQSTIMHTLPVLYSLPSDTNRVEHYPPGFIRPSGVHPFPPNLRHQEVGYPLPVGPLPLVHAPHFSYPPPARVEFPPPPIGVFASYSPRFQPVVPTRGAHYHHTRSNWVQNISAPNLLWNLPNQSSNMREIQSVNISSHLKDKTRQFSENSSELIQSPNLKKEQQINQINKLKKEPQINQKNKLQASSNLIQVKMSDTNVLPAETSVTNVLPAKASVTNVLPAQTSVTHVLPAETSVTIIFPAETSVTNILPAETSVTNVSPAKTSVTNVLPAETSVSTQKTDEKISRLHFIGSNTVLQDKKIKEPQEFNKETVSSSTALDKQEINTQMQLILPASQPPVKIPVSSTQSIFITNISNAVVSNTPESHQKEMSTQIIDVKSKDSAQKDNRKILIIGHTFVRQLYEDHRTFTVDSDVIIDGLCGAVVGQLYQRIRSLPKTLFSVVFIDVGSFDFIDPSVTVEDVVQRTLNIGIYLTTECDTKCVIINEIIPFPKETSISYYLNIGLANKALKERTANMDKLIYWSDAKRDNALRFRHSFDLSGRKFNKRGMEEYYCSVNCALISALVRVRRICS